MRRKHSGSTRTAELQLSRYSTNIAGREQHVRLINWNCNRNRNVASIPYPLGKNSKIRSGKGPHYISR